MRSFKESHLCKLKRVTRRDEDIRSPSRIQSTRLASRSKPEERSIERSPEGRGQPGTVRTGPERGMRKLLVVVVRKAPRHAAAGFKIRSCRFSRPGCCACRLRSVRLCGDRRLRSLSVAAVASCSQHTPRPDSKSGCRHRRFLIGSHVSGVAEGSSQLPHLGKPPRSPRVFDRVAFASYSEGTVII